MDSYEEFVLFLQQLLLSLCYFIYDNGLPLAYTSLLLAFIFPRQMKGFVQRLPYLLLSVALFLLRRLFTGSLDRACRVLLIDGWVWQKAAYILSRMRTPKISPTITATAAEAVSTPNEPLPPSLFADTPETTALPDSPLQASSVPTTDSTLETLSHNLLDSTFSTERPPCHSEPQPNANDASADFTIVPIRYQPSNPSFTSSLRRPEPSQGWKSLTQGRSRLLSQTFYPPISSIDENEDEDNQDQDDADNKVINTVPADGKVTEPINAQSTAINAGSVVSTVPEPTTPNNGLVISKPSESKAVGPTTPDNSPKLSLHNPSRPRPSKRPVRLNLQEKRKSEPLQGVSVSQLITDKRVAECQDTLALHAQTISEQSMAMADLKKYIKRNASGSEDVAARLTVIEKTLETILARLPAADSQPVPSSPPKELQAVAKDQDVEKSQRLIRQQARKIERYEAALDKRKQQCNVLEMKLATANENNKLDSDGLKKANKNNKLVPDGLKKANENNKLLSNSLKKANTTERALVRQVDQLKSTLGSNQTVQKSNLELQAENNQLKEALARSQANQSSQVEPNAVLQQLRDERDAAIKEMDAAKEESRGLETRTRELQAAEQVCQEDLHSLREEQKNASEETDALRQEAELAKLQFASSQAEGLDKDKVIEALHRQMAETRSQTSPLTAELQSRNAEIASLQAQAGQLHDMASQLQLELDGKSSEIQSYVQGQQAHDQKVQELEIWIEALRSEGQSLLNQQHQQNQQNWPDQQRQNLEAGHKKALAALCAEYDQQLQVVEERHKKKYDEMCEKKSREVDAARTYINEGVASQLRSVIKDRDEEISNMQKLWAPALKTAVQEAESRKDNEFKKLQEQLKSHGGAAGLGFTTPQKPIVSISSSPSPRGSSMFSPRQPAPQVKDLMMQKQCDQLHITSLKKDKAALEAHVKQAEEEITYLMAENDELLRQDKSKVGPSTADAQSEISRLQNENDSLKTKTAELEDKLSELMIDIDMVGVEKDELSEEHSKELDLKKAQLDQYGQKFTEATLRSKVLKEENSALENAYNMEKLHSQNKEQMQADLQQYQRERLAFYGNEPNLNMTRKAKRTASEGSEALKDHDLLKKRASVKVSDFMSLCDVTETDIVSHDMTTWSWTEAHHVSQLYFSLEDAEERNLIRFEQFVDRLGASHLIRPRTQSQEEVEAAFQSLIIAPKSFVKAPPAGLAGPQSSASFEMQGIATSPPLLGSPPPNRQQQASRPRKILQPRTRG